MARKKTNEYDDVGYDIDDSVKEKKNTRREKTENSRQSRGYERAEKPKKEKRDGGTLSVQIKTALLCLIALFFILCFIFSGTGNTDVVGIAGNFAAEFFYGILGISAITIPLFLIGGALHLKRDTENGTVVPAVIFSVLSVLLVSVLFHTVSCIFARANPSVICKGADTFFDGYTFAKGLGALYVAGKERIGGGLIGGFLSVAMMKLIGKAGAIILSLIFLLIFILFLFGATPATLWSRVKFYIIRLSEKRASGAKKESGNEKKKATGTHEQSTQSYAPAAQQNAVVVRGVKRGPSETFEFPDTIDFAPIKTDEVLYPVSENTQKQEDKIDISTIFDKPEDDKIKNDYTGYKPLDDDIPSEATLDISSANSLRVRRERTRPQKEAEPVAKAPQTPAYEFPPIDFLQNPPVVRTDDVENELRANANKITSTLESFNIHTTVVNVSRGPAVTRYEIAPEAGTKVSAIVSRAEDLSLGLASAVLIEGVIPGKSAIGIEVPNKKTSLVFLRQLIDDDEFKTAKSKLTASLGIDLTGSKIYLDIAKMPHLLIAGATGMGKSVCMNSLIVSLLYKATPDEVKFIFIDPKKVELSIYDGLPHLLVPVVSEPKKAAGALNWCVTEMERRYDLLEARGKRNVSQYNEAVEGDPTAEKLPQIVIVIDELADLMIAARDVVETSINRIAAKARAAGMHLVIGTQRPSVDVVTGTIKANIPSRIAFTMSSQVDSRTILDASGAEKLMGKGDMLYAPVGARLPFRVQGAFVDENEIEDIVSFIKEQSGGAAYDRDIAEQIEKEAEMCGKKGGKSSGQSYEADDDSSDEDPMLDAAIKLAIEEKKISTSLIQRRLSLGYGRAAKLIDAMEVRGIVSEPNGQKPRDVLISYEEYLERSMHSDS